MCSTNTTRFCKLKTCPSTEHLLACHTGTLATEKERETLEHLAACDFCAAEAALLAKFPPGKHLPCDSVEIPASLRLLAKALLKGAARRAENHVDPFSKREPLTLTDA